MPQKRFVRRGVSKFYFLPTVAALTKIPTRSELTAGTDLSGYIADSAGWGLENASVATPDMGSTFEGSIPGIDSAPDSSFTFYEDLDTDTIETLLPKGTNGFVVVLRKGDKPLSESMDTFPVRVATRTTEYSAGNDPARFSVRFTITDVPALDAPVPAAV
jgi:hypothetical protein